MQKPCATRTTLFVGAITVVAGMVFPQDPVAVLVSDVNPATESSLRDPPDPEFTESGGSVFFVAEGAEGTELWKTDGTEDGTSLVRDIHSFSSFPRDPVDVEDTLFFTAEDDDNGRQLWKSDGTEPGTEMVAVIRPGGTSDIMPWAGADGVLFFATNDGTNGSELWRSDGTGQGTFLLKDINPAGSSMPINVTPLGNDVIFSADEGGGNRELWISDGTTDGTVKLKEINPDNAPSNPNFFRQFGGLLAFVADTVDEGREVWRTDGTEAGTFMLADSNPGSASSFPGSLTPVGNALFFTATSSDEGLELWMTDGTPEDTEIVRDIVEGTGSTSFHSPFFAATSGLLYFPANDGVNGRELWRSDGTEEGTFLLKDILEGGGSSNVANIAEYQGAVYFDATSQTGPTSRQLWRTDGTPGGTEEFVVIRPGGSSAPRTFTLANDLLFFDALNDDGRELWRTNGTVEGTMQMGTVDPRTDTRGGSTNLFGMPGFLLFAADDGLHGREPMVSDGTVEGTDLLKDVNTAPQDSNPAGFTESGGFVYFSATTSPFGNELWRTDGTAEGTVMVKELRIDTEGSDPRDFIDLNGVILFTADDGNNGRELWRSDGTPEGTYLPFDINTDFRASSDPEDLTRIGDEAVFTAEDAAGVRDMWITNGNFGGTRLFFGAPKGSGADPTNTRNFIEVDGGLYFTGTAESGTLMVYFNEGGAEEPTEIDTGVAGAMFAFHFRQSGMFLYFLLSTGPTDPVREMRLNTVTNTVETVHTATAGNFDEAIQAAVAGPDGVVFTSFNRDTEKSSILRVLNTGTQAETIFSEFSSDGDLTEVHKLIEGLVILTRVTPEVGNEVFVLDPANPPPRLVKDILAGFGDALPEEIVCSPFLTQIPRLLFAARDKEEDSPGSKGDPVLFGRELWISDLTEEGTVVLEDINPGESGSNPEELTIIANEVYFRADNGTDGMELWKLEMDTPDSEAFWVIE